MSEAVRRIFVEKREEFAVEAHGMLADLRENLSLGGLKGIRIINRYDVTGLSDSEYAQARGLIFSEPPVDICYEEEIEIEKDARVFAIEYLPGQYDQRADSAEECISILTQKERPTVKTAKLIVLYGALSDSEFDAVKHYIINPVEMREASLEKPDTLALDAAVPEDVATIDGFTSMDEQALAEMIQSMGFAMDKDDLRFCRDYFKNTERRDPTVTELRMIDTYWSDHCRHTTFGTKIKEVTIPDGKYASCIREAYHTYLDTKQELYPQGRDTTLMDIALAAMKKLKKDGVLTKLDESEEINACSIEVDVDVDGRTEKWLIMFKNETHNHPTEIEPFGGAATCLGGAIRDPLSGRSYVYQAMRITGAGDPRKTMQETLPGKLMQKKIVRTAAAGYSSYGNQIGLATGQVAEIYHEGYVAKHMELGAVIAAAPKENVIRTRPCPGDVVILLGGKTGRDGCGGATGSSKAHTTESLETCGAEVQKGNPPVERKIQRLFRNGDVTRMIKRCNDFGAGGVSVAIGELADGLDIDLDKVPKKYDGLDGTELAISESQERMAVVVSRSDAAAFITHAKEENLDAVIVAVVTDKNRLTMTWRGKTICDISRDFLNTNGAAKTTTVSVTLPSEKESPFTQKDDFDLKDKWLKTLSSLNVCSQKGLVERFDSTIGAGSVLMPYGGKTQLTPTDGMVAKVPVLHGKTNTATVMTYGYDPYLSSWSPFHGSIYAVVESVSKAVALGARYEDIYLTLQEYFERLGSDPARWGKPFAALLGAFTAQKELGIAAIGGKDSMSGSFEKLDVPPTLVSFAVNTVKADTVVSPEFKKAGDVVVLVKVKKDENLLPDFAALRAQYEKIYELIQKGCVRASSVVKGGGLCEAVSKMCFGNMLGFAFDQGVTKQDLFAKEYGAIVLETDDLSAFDGLEYTYLGTVTDHGCIEVCGEKIGLADAVSAWESTLEGVYPTKAEGAKPCKTYSFERKSVLVAKNTFAKPRVFIPVFPGTNCEYDTARAFEAAGAAVDVLPFINLTPEDTARTLDNMAKAVSQAQIVMLPGGFSGGDEPDGSGKYIATAFRNPKVSDAVNELLTNRDGLMLGICNGFQALIKLGLVTHGQIVDLAEDAPTLTFNNIGRHVSTIVTTRIASNRSPWLYGVEVGDCHSIAVSHGEGRFYANEEWLARLVQNGQIATQYVNPDGQASADIPYNPNGSVAAIEGIISPDGRVFGKMGHSERAGENIFSNIEGEKDQKLFVSGVKYFK
ncbi:MAG TPA: phosphoribosylformylglycinamidine synthase [Candidatus Aphodoplasma excrementigallinarum]|uniref:Phosphoribosylformylglycinamidine synthase n=1 Tax=Candidatus Aphodoplasma excrementigallinarum TaxID=2840673 RepID=A0A9D1NHW8_9FIRM|nr:phosphoribosylformylglycinamidine synthase [Candidatus Aphodoplasma excrementigallinarum]